MASAIEALGMSLPNSSAQLAIGPEKKDDCRRRPARPRLAFAGRNQAPGHHDPQGLRECHRVVAIALGGSTNAQVLHLLAIAHSAGREARPGRLYPDRGKGPGAGRPEALRQGNTAWCIWAASAGLCPLPLKLLHDARPPPWRLPDRDRQDGGRKSWQGVKPISRPTRTWSARSTIRSRRTAICASSTATWPPAAQWPRFPARKA